MKNGFERFWLNIEGEGFKAVWYGNIYLPTGDELERDWELA